MPQPQNDPVLIGFALGTMLLSVLTDFYLLSMRRSGPLLPYEPRRPVPWNASATLLAILYLLATFLSLGGGATPQGPEPTFSTFERAEQLILTSLTQIVLVGGFLFVVAVFSNANKRDLGLPASKDQFARDIFIGAVACLAALAPVHVVQIGLIYLLYPEGEPSGHPLVKMVMSAPPSPVVLVLTAIAAVVVAPICEEITFRLLLQGWLEKWTDRRMTNDEARTTNDEHTPSDDSSFVIGHSSLQQEPPHEAIVALPHGWFPILISSLLFGLAHVGYGPEPVPLFLLALVLGYVYQRTHRIVPCIVAHALFNLFTMVLLWRMVVHPS